VSEWRILVGDVRDTLATLEPGSVQTCATSPPYWGLRDYGHDGQIGLEATPDAYVAQLVEVFREVRRVLRDDGTVWINLGDSYAGGGVAGSDAAFKGKQGSNRGNVGMVGRALDHGLKPKDLVGIPWRVAFALQADGWYLRSDVIWSKPNPMPESVTDRPTKAHEYIFLLSKSARYYYDAQAIYESATGTTDRPQQRRALDLSKAAGLTDEHIKAIRSCGVSDAGKAQSTQSGYLKNAHDTQRLANEAKAALGGYYREFLMSDIRNKRSVWHVATQPYAEAHFATFPEDLILPCILAGSRPGDLVLDPFAGSGTTGAVSVRNNRDFIGCELNPVYVELARKRIGAVAPLFATERTA
jgi:site-specific DNA-methyltransferase (cytosine-N4-specific)